MHARVLRLSVLALAAFASLASSQPQQSGQPVQPLQYGPAAGSGAATFSCYALQTQSNIGSMCFGAPDRCDHERQAAQADGASTSNCEPRAPVSCFQLGGDPNPSMEVCAATTEDCELWRQIDNDKNGSTGDACAWRHATN